LSGERLHSRRIAGRLRQLAPKLGSTGCCHRCRGTGPRGLNWS
jgi:hypothetical protein